jgi:hypothetical protein
MNWKRWIPLLLLIGAAGAQQREIGILGGGGLSNGLPILGAPVSASAGILSGPAVGVLLGQDLYSHWSGEIRYLFERREFRLAAGGGTAGFSGQSHALHYDIIYQHRTRNNRLRPYLAGGGGVKLFRGTGQETAYRPLMEDAYLTRTQQIKPMLTAGGGIKVQTGNRMLLRIDIGDQITRFPEKIVAAAPGRKLQGWLHDFVPSVGVSWRF